ncbi:kinase-like domain-containing protein [Aspergillus spinulosporus]
MPPVSNVIAATLKFLLNAASIPEKPRKLPTAGFPIIQKNQLIEEEELPDYKSDWFFPVKLGEIFQGCYQVIAKLGFVYVHVLLVHREIPFYHHIRPQLENNSPKERINIQSLLDSFEITGPRGMHIVLVFEATQMSLRDMKALLKTLDFLHTNGKTVHTDMHPGNMLLGAYDNAIFQKLKEKEFASPVPRKQDSSGRTIYLSRLMRPTEGPMLLSDFGEARIGQGPHGGDIMPLEYRAPETLLYVGWSFPVDVWSVGLTAWDLLEPKKLFTARDDDGDCYDAAHIAQLIAALGPPPAEFLAKNPKRKADFWSEKGEWLGLAPIPHGRTLEALETRLEDKSGFLRFIRRTLTWLPENRPTASELLEDPWLTDEKV